MCALSDKIDKAAFPALFFVLQFFHPNKKGDFPMKTLTKRILCALLALLLVCSLSACGGAKTVDPATCTYDEMVEYLTAKGYIAKDAAPVDMLTTEGYLTDNTGGDFPFGAFADRAEDYGGLWLMWWDSATPSEAYSSCFAYIDMNDGVVVYMGGAATLETAAHNGSFAIAFSEDYAEKDAVIADFSALTGK